MCLSLPVGVLSLQTPSVRLVIRRLIVTERDVGFFTLETDLTCFKLGHAARVEETGPHEDPEEMLTFGPLLAYRK
jgi:hypothetical protein